MCSYGGGGSCGVCSYGGDSCGGGEGCLLVVGEAMASFRMKNG